MCAISWPLSVKFQEFLLEGRQQIKFFQSTPWSFSYCFIFVCISRVNVHRSSTLCEFVGLQIFFIFSRFIIIIFIFWFFIFIYLFYLKVSCEVIFGNECIIWMQSHKDYLFIGSHVKRLVKFLYGKVVNICIYSINAEASLMGVSLVIEEFITVIQAEIYSIVLL